MWKNNKFSCIGVLYGKMDLLKYLIVVSLLFYSGNMLAADKKLLLPLPQRDAMAVTGSTFVKTIDTVAFEVRENRIAEEILSGNIPGFLREFRKFSYRRNGTEIEFYALPDYLAIGTGEDFIRMPMGPVTAQRIADSLFCSLPTALLVDEIARASEGAIEPFPFRPLGERNTFPVVFEDSNNAINALYRAKGYEPGQLISGLKKDVILWIIVTV